MERIAATNRQSAPRPIILSSIKCNNIIDVFLFEERKRESFSTVVGIKASCLYNCTHITYDWLMSCHYRGEGNPSNFLYTSRPPNRMRVRARRGEGSNSNGFPLCRANYGFFETRKNTAPPRCIFIYFFFLFLNIRKYDTYIRKDRRTPRR